MSGIDLLLTAMGTGELLVSASPPSLNSGGSDSASQTAPTTAIPSGGVGPFTALWSIISSSGGSFAIVSPASLSTRFNLNIYDDVGLATARCTVIDTATGSIGTVDVVIRYRVRYDNPGGGPIP